MPRIAVGYHSHPLLNYDMSGEGIAGFRGFLVAR